MHPMPLAQQLSSRQAPPGAARALLVGWLAFWLLALVQPFCDGWAGETRDADSGSASTTTWSAGAHRVLDHDPCCAAISDAALDAGKVLDVAVFSQGDGGIAMPSYHFRVSQLTWRPVLDRAKTTPPPLDSSPLYLRTLRLRI